MMCHRRAWQCEAVVQKIVECQDLASRWYSVRLHERREAAQQEQAPDDA
jgi:hypothetical protein